MEEELRTLRSNHPIISNTIKEVNNEVKNEVKNAIKNNDELDGIRQSIEQLNKNILSIKHDVNKIHKKQIEYENNTKLIYENKHAILQLKDMNDSYKNDIIKTTLDAVKE